jgi:hypothetical protein
MLNSLHTDAAFHPVHSLNRTARATGNRREFFLKLTLMGEIPHWQRKIDGSRDHGLSLGRELGVGRFCAGEPPM